MRIILLGPPGAGKGTQAVILKEKLNIVHISTGDIFRQKVKDGSEIGKKAKSYMDRGALVPDEVVVAMVKERLQEADTKNGFILDGFPRTREQAIQLDKCLADLKVRIDLALDFDAREDIIVARLSGRRVCKVCGSTYHVKNMPPKVAGVCDKCKGEIVQRKDDEESTIRNRIKVYNETAIPLKKYYEEKKILVTIDASSDYKEVDRKLDVLFKNKFTS